MNIIFSLNLSYNVLVEDRLVSVIENYEAQTITFVEDVFAYVTARNELS